MFKIQTAIPQATHLLSSLTMPWIRAYGKVDEANQASLDARRRTIRRLFIIGVSAAILLAVILAAVLATKHGSSATSDSGAHPSSFATSVKAICGTTLYPSSCLDTLSPMANSTALDPIKLFHRLVEVASNELTKALRHFQEMKIKPGSIDQISSAALTNCIELVELAVDHLNDCSASIDLTSGEIVDDLKTWLSAAITNQDTCIDGFADSELKTEILTALKNSTEFTSNSLAIVTEFSKFIGSIKLRRLMSYYHLFDGAPSWISSKDRKLLQSSLDPRRNANIVVAKDGSGKYKTIKAALAAVPEKSKKRFVIYVKKGVYYENVKVEKNKWNVIMAGDGKDMTIVSGRLNFVDGTPTYSTATFAVFGKGFIAQDMGFQNTAGPAKHQAVAMMSTSDQSIFYRCKFDAYQDTLYAQSQRQFYRECSIYGTVDFIFGNAAALLQNCNILPRVPLQGQQDTITAQGKVDPNQNTGISIHSCTISPFGNLNSVRVYLGRPWKAYSTTVYMQSMMSSIIDPAGWLPWTGNSAPDTIFYSEYRNFGPGASTNRRVKWKGLRSMNSKQANRFTVGSFLGGSAWISRNGIPFKSGL